MEVKGSGGGKAVGWEWTWDKRAKFTAHSGYALGQRKTQHLLVDLKWIIRSVPTCRWKLGLEGPQPSGLLPGIYPHSVFSICFALVNRRMLRSPFRNKNGVYQHHTWLSLTGALCLYLAYTFRFPVRV